MPLRHAGEVLAAKYRIDALLGTGGMGDVYRATNTLIGRSVAIKLLHPKHAENPDVVERFLREARVANMLRHPNVVDVIDVDRDEHGVPFIVQELLAGEDLARYVQPKGRLDTEEIEKLIVPIIDAIAFAHSQGVIHRDIKPANVFLARVRVGADMRTANETATSIKRNATATATEQIVPKLLDFGISKLQTPAGGIKATDVGVVLGTPAYMAPELLTGARDANPASDVWSIGVMLFELLAGRRPFDGSGANIYVVVATTEAPRLREVASDVDADLASVVDRCLMRSTAERYTSAVDLSQDLSEALNQARLRTPEPIRRTPQREKKADVVVPDLDLPPTFYPVDKTRLDDARTVVDPTQMTKILNPVSSRKAVVPELALPSNTSGNTVIEPPVTTPPPISGPRATALMRKDAAPAAPAPAPPLVIETPVMELAPTSVGPPLSVPPSSPRQLQQQAPISSNPRIAVTAGSPAGWQQPPPGSERRAPAGNEDMARLMGPTAIVLVSAIVMAILKGLFGRPGGFAIVRPFVDLAPQLNTAAQAGCALVCFVVAVRAFRRALVKWRSGEKAVALVFAATCGALFFATWELARAAL